MPNWCSNKIKITHDDPVMIEKFNCKTPLQAVVPCPFDPDKSDKWYDWRISNWGTKWDITLDNVMIENDGRVLLATFESAWSPPLEAYWTMLRQGYIVEAIYWESGGGFCGAFYDGDELDFVYPSFQDDNWRDNLIPELAEALEPDYQGWLDYQEELKRDNA